MVPRNKQISVTLNHSGNTTAGNVDVSKDALNALDKNPPVHQNTDLSTKTVGKTTIVSEGSIGSETVSKLNGFASQTPTAGTPYDLNVIDTTGKYGYLINSLKSYMATSLLWTKQELPSLHEIRFVDAGASGWSGMYNGAYSTDGTRITSVYAYIDLNVYYYASSPYILEYLEMTLAHEYGHHFSLYNKWLTYQIPYSARFPDSYYQARPLSMTTTAPDYSKGWANCDAEIVAEDYKYLFSPFKNQQMAATYGYPSDPGTRNWFLSFGRASGASDTVAPTISILSPAANAVLTGTISLAAAATDNVAVSKVEYFLNSDSLGLAAKSGDFWQLSFNSKSKQNGAYSLKATACDQSNNCQDAAENISINNQAVDSTPPAVNITSPTNGQTVSGTINFSADITDDVKVDNANFYLDSALLDTKTIAPFAVAINTLSYPNGNHQLKVVASDGLNTTTKEITIIIGNQTGGDTEIPTVQIASPSTSPYSWDSGNLNITAIGSDNVGVVKMEFYINNTLVATENSSSISRTWQSHGTPNGSYTLKAKAYDAAGNSAETSVTINKS